MPLAILEISCVAIYLIPTTVLGAFLLTGYIEGVDSQGGNCPPVHPDLAKDRPAAVTDAEDVDDGEMRRRVKQWVA